MKSAADRPQPTPPAMDRRALLGLAGLGAALALDACTPGHAQQPQTATSPSARASSRASVSPTAPARVTKSTEVTHGSRTGTAVALTFHGAGDPALARQVLHLLKQRHTVATVFAVGMWLDANPSVGPMILSEGHELGNHTYHHLPMRQLSARTAYTEILRGHEAVARSTGAYPRWFRPSGTPHATSRILSSAGRVGYQQSIAYDVDPADYADPGAALVVRRTLDSLRAGSIVSLHLGHVGTATALPKILDGIAARGMTPVGLSTLLVERSK